MASTEPNLPRSIALVADVVSRGDSLVSSDETTLEMSSPETRDRLAEALGRFIPKVVVVDSPAKLVDIASTVEMVMTIYGGVNSRNRMALVPAVCEAVGLPYAGADTYARIICQDKHLSKLVAKEVGLGSPNGLLIRAARDLDLVMGLRPPLVVKPNLEGSSIGIGTRNLVRSSREATDLASDLLKKFSQPILIEEFAPGKEVSYCISGNASEINFFEAIEDFHKEDPDFFMDNLFTAECKNQRFGEFSHRRVTSEVSSELRDTLCRLYMALGKLDYVRIDCRVDQATSQLIEITPDPYLGENGAFSDAFATLGMKYEDGIRLLVSNACRPH